MKREREREREGEGERERWREICIVSSVDVVLERSMLVSGSVNNLKEREQKICYHTYNKYSTGFRCVFHYSKRALSLMYFCTAKNIEQLFS